MTNEVLQTVIDYVKLPHTDYAVLINGPWGCGKTYFWKNMVGPELKRLLDSKHIERVLYISLYGISDVKDIDRSLFAQSYPGINKKCVGKISRFVGGAIEALGYVDLAKVDLRSLVKVNDSVVCFDDLERSNLPFKEVLGYINTFVEHEGSKVVILCNEKAIDAADIELYKKMKEKVVGNSLDYQPAYKTVLSTLTDEYKDQKEFHDFLVKNNDLILHLFKSSETDNLRSLRRAITTLNMVLKTIYEGDIDPNKLSEQLIYAVGPTAFELYGRAANPEKLKTIHSMNYISLAGISVLRRTLDQSAKKTYEEEFNERYFGTDSFLNFGKAIGCLPICEFMITGFLDKKALLDWAKELTKVPDEKEERIKQLQHFRDMGDDEFKTKSSLVLEEIEKGEIIDISTYLNLYPLFEYFAGRKLISANKEQIFEKFKTGSKKAQQSGKLKPEIRFESNMHFIMQEPRTKECKEFCEYVAEMNKSMVEDEKRNAIKKIFSNLQDDPQALIDALVGTEKTDFVLKPIFHELDANKTADQILSLPTSLKTSFVGAMYVRYLKYQPNPEYIPELPVLTAIRDIIKKTFEESSKGLQTITISLSKTLDIVQILDQIIERFQKGGK